MYIILDLGSRHNHGVLAFLLASVEDGAVVLAIVAHVVSMFHIGKSNIQIHRRKMQQGEHVPVVSGVAICLR